MFRKFAGAVLVGVITLGPVASRAQTGPYVQSTTITFNGVVSSETAQTVKVLDPATRTLVPYTGPVPAFALPAGQPVTISFKADLPTKAFFDSFNAALVANGQKALGADTNGIIPVTAVSNLTTGSPQGARVSSVTYSNGLGAYGSNADPTYPIFAFERLNLIYDLKTDTYSINPSVNPVTGVGAFENTGVAGAGYTFDVGSGKLVACTTDCAQIAGAGRGVGPDFTLASGADPGSISSSFGLIYDTLGRAWGTFQLGFSGSWSLPTYNPNATAVPEPGMLGLYGGGTALLAIRRRRSRRSRRATA